MVKIKKFKNEDTEVLAKIMKRAFDNDSQIHLGKNGGPEGYDNGQFIEKWFKDPKATPLTIYDDDKIIGGINLWLNDNNVNYLGCIFIDPDYENKGYGTHVWKMIEKKYPNTVEWRTDTPIFSHRNHNYYVNKCGFAVVKIENPKDLEEGSFKLRKVYNN